jgi:8-oxo-dGTP pyrophosphatase MutT (NUDIX family)
MYGDKQKHYIESHGNGAGILYLVEEDNPSRRYFILGKSVHKHEWEIPGGKQDPDDPSIIYTAARESVEEFGLQPKFHKKIVDFITKYPISVSIYHPKGVYVLYVVKLKSFDFKKANSAAKFRLQVFDILDYYGQSELRTLVEMSEYGKINMWEYLAGKENNLDGFTIRERDMCLLHLDELINKVYYVSRNEKFPMFEEPFEFINFDEIIDGEEA